MAEDRRDESSGESNEILHIPKTEIKVFLDKMLEKNRRLEAQIREIKEETNNQVGKIKKEVKDFKDRPFDEIAKDYGVETKRFTEKIAREALDSAISEVKPRIKSEVRSGVVEELNRVYRSEDKTIEDSIRTQKKREFWGKFRAWSYAVAAFSAISLAGYALYDSSQRTADSAVGDAKKAIKIAAKSLEESKASRLDVNSYKTESDAWRKKNEEYKKSESEARRKEQSDLEQKLVGQIVSKADRIGYDAKIADLKKDYDKLYGMLQAESKKEEGRENAYFKYKELADATKALSDSTKLTLDELVKKYSEFEKKVAMKENTESEIASIRNTLDNEIKQKIKDYDNLITQMQEIYKKNDEEAKNLRGLLNNIEGTYKEFKGLLNNIESSYKGIEKRVQKLEEGREK